MLRVLTMSDLHLEFAEFEMDISRWPDVVILAGDIGIGATGIRFAREQIPRTVPVVVIAGNHEFYGSSIEAVTQLLRTAASELENVHFLDCNELIIRLGGWDTRILGATLWIDFALRGNASESKDMETARRRMNDFRLISFRGRLLTPRDTVELHEVACTWLDAKLAKQHNGPTIVVTHDSPTARSERDVWVHSDLSAAFHSNLDWMIERHQPDLWIHGHSHWSVDYQIGRTRIFSNQRGYPGEACSFSTRAIVL